MEISEKYELREQMLQKRLELPYEEEARMNQALFERLTSLGGFTGKEVSSVYTYVSCRREPDTRRLISWLLDNRIPVAVPRVSGRDMDFYYIKSQNQLVPGFMDIPEPDSSCKKAGDLCALVILPGLAFDLEGGRLGYGGGYYDRFLAREPNHKTIGLAFAFQMVPRVPQEAYDKKADLIVVSDMVITPEHG